MAEKPYLLKESTAKKIGEIIRRDGPKPRPRTRPYPDDGPHILLAYSETEITARDGTEPGSGNASVKRVTNNGTADAIGDLDPTYEMTVYNLAATAIAADKYLMLVREYISGRWFVVWEEC